MPLLIFSTLCSFLIDEDKHSAMLSIYQNIASYTYMRFCVGTSIFIFCLNGRSQKG